MRTERPRGAQGRTGRPYARQEGFLTPWCSPQDARALSARLVLGGLTGVVAGLSLEANDCQTDARNDDWPGRFGMNKRIPHATSPRGGPIQDAVMHG